MDTEKCKALLCALDAGTLSAAAEKLGYTPSGISRMMDALEQETGFPLLVRSRGGVTATGECEKMLPCIRELANQGERYGQLAAEVRGLSVGSITIGTSYEAYFRWIAELIAGFCKKYPGIQVNTLQGPSTLLSEAVEERRADFCIISQREGNYEWIPLKDDPMVAILPVNHPLAGERAFPLKRLAVEPYIEAYPGTETDNTRLFAEKRIKPNVRFSSTDIVSTVSLVEAGLGVSIINSLILEVCSSNVAALPLEPPQQVSIGIALPSWETASPAARKFIAFAKSRMAGE